MTDRFTVLQPDPIFMSLSRKAKTQLFKWMQERHKDLHVVSDRLFWGVPLSHVLCGIAINGSSRKDRFSVLAQVTPLYQSATMFTLGWSSIVRGPAPKHGGYWFGTDPDLHNAFEDIYLNTIRPEIDPYHNLSNLEVYQQHRIETHQEGGVPEATLALTQLALGKFDQARATWQRVVDTTPAGILKVYETGGTIVTLQAAFKKLEEGHALEIPALLREAEKKSVEALGIDDLWHPAAFPCEVTEGL